MGGEIFITEAFGQTAEEAFINAQIHARYWNGHRGYTGTIAEKTEFILIDDYTETEINDLEKWINDARLEDKWGPCGCLKLTDEKYLFFGWAST